MSFWSHKHFVDDLVASVTLRTFWHQPLPCGDRRDTKRCTGRQASRANRWETSETQANKHSYETITCTQAHSWDHHMHTNTLVRPSHGHKHSLSWDHHMDTNTLMRPSHAQYSLIIVLIHQCCCIDVSMRVEACRQTDRTWRSQKTPPLASEAEMIANSLWAIRAMKWTPIREHQSENINNICKLEGDPLEIPWRDLRDFEHPSRISLGSLNMSRK